jgi:hypothetical protein
VILRILKNIFAINYIFLFLPLPILLIFGCNSTDSTKRQVMDEYTLNDESIEKIVYQYMDASVPPEYHRSYVITLTPYIIKIIVDSYGDIIAAKDYEIKKDQYANIVRSFQDNRIRNIKLDEIEDCTGGTGERIICYVGEKELFSGTVYYCGGKIGGNMGGDIKRFADDIRKLIPNLDDLLAEGGTPDLQDNN